MNISKHIDDWVTIWSHDDPQALGLGTYKALLSTGSIRSRICTCVISVRVSYLLLVANKLKEPKLEHSGHREAIVTINYVGMVKGRICMV